MRDLTEQPFELGCAKGYRIPGFNAPLSKYGSMTNFRCSAQGYPPKGRLWCLGSRVEEARGGGRLPVVMPAFPPIWSISPPTPDVGCISGERLSLTHKRHSSDYAIKQIGTENQWLLYWLSTTRD